MKSGNTQLGKYMAVMVCMGLTFSMPARAEFWMIEATWNWIVGTGYPNIQEHTTEIAALQAENAALAAENSGHQASIAELLTRVDALEAAMANPSPAAASDLDPYVTVDESDPLRPVVRFEGVNVQIVNGMGSTASVNGVGNLLVGYDEHIIDSINETGTPPPFNVAGMCTLPGHHGDPQSCTDAGGYMIQFESRKLGSHNVVVGSYNGYSQYGALVAGYMNQSSAPYASVTGGYANAADQVYASITGGSENVAQGLAASVTGGFVNRALGDNSSISGGYLNRSQGEYASVSGGRINSASGRYSSVTGGESNESSGLFASVTGGRENVAAGRSSSVTGGGSSDGSPGGNVANGDYSTVTGGYKNFTNAAGGWSTVVGGAGNNTSGNNSVVSGGHNRSTTGPNDWVAGDYFQDN